VSQSKVEVGDIIHWTMVWGKEIDAWGVVIDAKRPDSDDFEMMILLGAESNPDRETGRAIKWVPGNTTNLGLQSHNVTCEVVPDDEVPSFIWPTLAKYRLTGRFR
jgi:hypothetical protein